MQEAGFLGRADVGLGGGVQLDRWHVDLQQAHVLNDQRVHAGVVQLPGQFARGLQLVVAQDRVHGHEDAAVEAVRVLRQASNLFHRVVGTGARAKRRPANVDRVGPVVHGLDADVGVAGGGEQFELVREHGRGRW